MSEIATSNWTRGIRTRIGLVREKSPHLDRFAAADLMISKLSPEEMKQAARAWMIIQVDAVDQERRRRIERSSSHSASTAKVEDERNRKMVVANKELRDEYTRLIPSFELWFNSPGSMPVDALNSPNRPVGTLFKRWAKENRKELHPVIQEASQAHGFELVSTLIRWGFGVQALEIKIHRDVEDASRKMVLELTEPLLKQEFALGDGVRVTWAEATKEQHEERIKMQVGKAASITQDAARHAAAIRILDENRAKTLKEVAR